MCFRVFELEMIYFFFFFSFHDFSIFRCTILMADRKTEGILSSEILDGFIKLEEK